MPGKIVKFAPKDWVALDQLARERHTIGRLILPPFIQPDVVRTAGMVRLANAPAVLNVEPCEIVRRD